MEALREAYTIKEWQWEADSNHQLASKLAAAQGGAAAVANFTGQQGGGGQQPPPQQGGSYVSQQ